MDEGTPAVFEEVLHPGKRKHPKNERWSPKILIQFWWAKKKAWDISEMQWLAEIKVTGESTRWSSWMTRPSQEINHWCQPPDDRKSQIDGISPDDPMTFIITKVAKSLGRKLTITGRFLLFCGAKCQGSWFLWGGITLDANGCQNGHFEGAFPTKKSLSFLSYVDGWNLAPVGMVNFPLFTGFYTSQVVQGVLPSTETPVEGFILSHSRYGTFYPFRWNERVGPVDGSEIPKGPMWTLPC